MSRIVFRNLLLRYICSAALGLLLLVSCRNRQSGLIGEKDMVEIMTDMQLAEAYASNQITGKDRDERRLELADAVLASHGVTQEQLDSTLQWYGRNLDDYSKLYEKVDKRLLSKKKELTKDDQSRSEETVGDNLWPFNSHGVVTPLGISDGWILALSNPEIQRGDRLIWKLHLSDASTPLNGVLGVEYSDGTSEASSTFFTNRKSVELSLQTDTGKNVERIYGTMRFKEKVEGSLFADSISLRKIPYDSLEYYRGRSQKRYGLPVRRDFEKERRKQIADSLRRDSINKVRKLEMSERGKKDL